MSGMKSPMTSAWAGKNGQPRTGRSSRIDVQETWEPGQGTRVKDPIGKIFQPVKGSGAGRKVPNVR